ncbi:hypothetical protein [Sediminibacillus halophilus]|uniref:Uncharacterized protein n=1 Tax=Sediminibacillus halophilus TaxID=482461 RepID=A0A1G9TGL0_9BACI|nr:hypothetical protein [Sediminibacillus halophilus]SDM46753.1 hypothetical protein SAMN05216244_2575 [Sediminibacillus halophilus]
MKGEELSEAVDFKKLSIVELQIKFEQLKNKYPKKKKIIFVTQSATIEADFQMQLAENLEEEPILGRALQEYELSPEIDITDKIILNSSACIYLRNVKLTPLTTPNSPIYLEEFILFTDHLLGLTIT